MIVNRLLLLGLACLAVGCVVLIVQNSTQRATIGELNGKMATAEHVSKANHRTMQRLAQEKADLVTKIAADTAAAELAQDRYTRLELQYNALETHNERLRDDLATDDPVVADWFSTGMPVAVACSMWPTEPSCSN